MNELSALEVAQREHARNETPTKIPVDSQETSTMTTPENQESYSITNLSHTQPEIDSYQFQGNLNP